MFQRNNTNKFVRSDCGHRVVKKRDKETERKWKKAFIANNGIDENT